MEVFLNNLMHGICKMCPEWLPTFEQLVWIVVETVKAVVLKKNRKQCLLLLLLDLLPTGDVAGVWTV